MERGILASKSLLLLLGWICVGCSVKHPCSDNENVTLGQCVVPPATGGGDGSTGSEGGSSGKDPNSDDEGEGGGVGGELTAEEDTASDDDAVEDVAPNFGASCTTHEECTGKTVCGAEGGLPICLGMCGPGDPFEGNCPTGMACSEPQPGSFICF